MKNRLLSLILTVAMLVSMMPVTVMAAEEGPKVLIDHVKYVDNGELCQDVDENGEESPRKLPKGVSYNERTQTLTLDHAKLDFINIHGGGELTLILKGSSEIRNVKAGPAEDGTIPPAMAVAGVDVTIQGPGQLTIDAAGTDVHAFKLDDSQFIAEDGAKLIVQKPDSEAFTSSVADVHNGSLIVRGGAVLEVNGLSGMYLVGNNHRFEDCTVKVNALHVRKSEVLIDDGAVLTCSAEAINDDEQAGALLQIVEGSRFLVDGGELQFDTQKASNGRGAFLTVAGQGSVLELCNGRIDAGIDGNHSLNITEQATFRQSGGILHLDVNGEVSGLQLDDGSAEFLGGTTELEGKWGVSIRNGSMNIDGGDLDVFGTDGEAISVVNGGSLTVESGYLHAEVVNQTLPLTCAVGGHLSFLGGSTQLVREGWPVVMAAYGDDPVTYGNGVRIVNDDTGEEVQPDLGQGHRLFGSSVTIGTDIAEQPYSCDFDITSGVVTQGGRANLRAIVSLGAPKGDVTFELPDGFEYVSGSMTVDSKKVTPTSTKPLTVSLQRGGTARFSVVATEAGKDYTLTAKTTVGQKTYEESLTCNVRAFELSLPSRTARREIPVEGAAVPNSMITFYEGTKVLGKAESTALGTWSGTVTLPNVEGDHVVYAIVDLPTGSTVRSQDHIVTYEPEANEVKTLTIKNSNHGRTELDPPVESSLVIDYVTGEDSADYYIYWQDLPRFNFEVDFVQKPELIESVDVVTTDRQGNETRIPMKLEKVDESWRWNCWHNYDMDDIPYEFRVEYVEKGEAEEENTGKFIYDELDRVILFKQDDGSDISYTYDDQNRIQEIANDDYGISFTYDYKNDGVTYRDDQGHEIYVDTHRDGKDGYAAEFELPMGGVLKYQYDKDLNVTGITDGEGNKVGYRINASGVTDQITYPDGTTERLIFNADGKTKQFVQRSGETIHYDYDKEGRITRITADSGEVLSYTYDDRDRVTSITDNGKKTILTYDSADNLTKVTYPDGKFVAYRYDDQGRRTQMTDSDGYLTGYVYDEEGYLHKITDGTSALVTYSYDSQGQLTKQVNGNGTYTTYTYKDDELTAVRNYGADGEVESFFEYAYNKAGLITAMIDNSGQWSYDYDEMDQLIKVADPQGHVTSYVYDNAGNRSAVAVDGVTTMYRSNELNQYIKYGDTTRIYDENGQISSETRNGETAEYTYNAWGELTEYVDFDGTVYRYEYDAFGLRSSVTVDGKKTSYLNDPTGTGYAVASYGEEEIHYVVSDRLSGFRVDGQEYFYHNNYQGSVTEITDEQASVVNRYTYDAEGNVLDKTETVTNPYTYVGVYGLINDGNGLIYNRERYVSVGTNSFLSPDPAGMVYDTNLYRYAYDNPVMYIDITGRDGNHIFDHLNQNYPMPNDSFEPGGTPNQGNLKSPNSASNSSPNLKGTQYKGSLSPQEIAAANGKVTANKLIGETIGKTIGKPTGKVVFARTLTKIGLWTTRILCVTVGVGLGFGPWGGIGGAIVGEIICQVIFPDPVYGAELPPREETIHSTPNRSVDVVLDPSGYVYEGIPTNRLEGVTTTLYYSDAKTKPASNASESQKWVAAEFNQMNPLTTDVNGQYLWMVPDGYWQVKYEKAGYETVWSDWLPVPPIQTDVNVGMTSKEAATPSLEGSAEPILRFDRPVRIETVNASAVQIAKNGAALKGQFVAVDQAVSADGEACATTFTFRITDGTVLKGGDKLTMSCRGVITYAGTSSQGTDSAEVKNVMPFTDVKETNYFYGPVLWAVNHKPQITSGTNAAGTLFSPAKGCTRGQVMTFLWRAMGEPMPKSTGNPFSDVKTTDYYYNAVLWAVENGVTGGTGGGKFSPNQICTRGQIVTFLYKALNGSKPAQAMNPFKDVPANAYYSDPVLWAVDQKVTSGTSATTFSPNATCTRGQIVTFLYNATH